MTTINLPENYGWLLVTVILFGLELTILGFVAGRKRRVYFTKQFFEKNFPDLVKAVGFKELAGGYPEMGSGRFADKLSDREWLDFNNHQRAHQNLLEIATPAVVMMLVGGLVCTKSVILASWIFMAGRAVYAWGYITLGARGRRFGIFGTVALLYLLGASLYAAFTLGGGITGLKTLLP